MLGHEWEGATGSCGSQGYIQDNGWTAEHDELDDDINKLTTEPEAERVKMGITNTKQSTRLIEVKQGNLDITSNARQVRWSLCHDYSWKTGENLHFQSEICVRVHLEARIGGEAGLYGVDNAVGIAVVNVGEERGVVVGDGGRGRAGGALAAGVKEEQVVAVVGLASTTLRRYWTVAAVGDTGEEGDKMWYQRRSCQREFEPRVTSVDDEDNCTSVRLEQGTKGSIYEVG
ncbi:hypothetical protein BDQ17DRAFT_1328301 [Cyathus striatus]|nr:hypothetical protein BDQ17DRAFT_1328301 [Cyathus striatus]